MKKVIRVGVGPQGQVSVEAIGFTDGTCLKETASYEEAIGTVKARNLKPEASRKARRELVKETECIPSGWCG